MEKIVLFLSLFIGCSPAFASGNLPVNVIPGCVLYLSFDEGSGTTVFDKSMNGNNGSFGGTPSWVTGRNGYGVQFDKGSNDVVNVADSASLKPTTISIVFWYKQTERSNNLTGFGLINKVAGAGTSWSLDDGLIVGATRSIYFELNSLGVTDFVQGTIPIDDLRPHVIICTYDLFNMRIFIDGRTAGSFGTISALDYTAPNNLRIGNFNATTQGCYAIMDDVAIFSRALKSGEVAYISSFLLGQNEQSFLFTTFGRPNYESMIHMDYEKV